MTEHQYLITMSKTKADRYEIHGEGCRHTTRLPLHLVFSNASGETPEAVKADLLIDFEGQGWTKDSVKIMECSKNAPVI